MYDEDVPVLSFENENQSIKNGRAHKRDESI